MAPGWYPDPYGRFELRFCTGSFWTGHVLSQGTYAFDDVAPVPLSTALPREPRLAVSSTAAKEPLGIVPLAVVVLVCVMLAAVIVLL